MADYGLLGGIGNGLQQGLLMYQRQKQINRDNQVQNLTSGLQDDGEGNLSLNPMMQAKQQAQGMQTQDAIASHDANSAKSQHTRALYKGILAKSSPGTEKSITDDMSDADINAEGSPLKAAISGGYGMQGNQMKSIAMGGRVNVMQDNQAEQAVQKVHNDPVIKQMRQQATNIDKAVDGMNNPSHQPSMTEMNEYAQDISAALSGKGVSSDFKLKEISTPSIEGKMQQLKAFVTANPDQPAPPEQVQFWKDMGQRLQGAYDRQMAARANNVTVGTKTAFAHNPTATQAMSEAADLYKTGKWRDTGMESADQPAAQAPAAQSGAHPQDAAAVQWAQANPNDPRSAAILKTNGVQPAQQGFMGKVKGLLGVGG